MRSAYHGLSKDDDIEKGTKVIADFPVINKKIDTEIRQVSNYINPNNRSFKIEVGVPNKDGLIKPNLIFHPLVQTIRWL